MNNMIFLPKKSRVTFRIQTLFITLFQRFIEHRNSSHLKHFFFAFKKFNVLKKLNNEVNRKASYLLGVRKLGTMVKSIKTKLFRKIRNKTNEIQYFPQKIEILFLIIKKIFNTAAKRHKKLIFSLFRSEYNNIRQRVLIETEEMKLLIPTKKAELEEIDEDLCKTQHLVSVIVQKAEKCLKCSNFFANDKVINTLQSIDFNNIQSYKSNSISSQLFEIPNSKYINQKTESMADKDFEMPVSKDIYKSNKSSVFEKDFRLPTSQDILRNSDADVSFKNYKRLTKDKEEMVTLRSMESDFESVNKEISLEENVGKEYSAYLAATLRELSKKKEEMDYNYLFKMQGLKFEIQVKILVISEPCRRDR